MHIECFHWVLSSTFYLVVCEMPLVCCSVKLSSASSSVQFYIQSCSNLHSGCTGKSGKCCANINRTGQGRYHWRGLCSNQWKSMSSCLKPAGVPLTGKHLRSKSNFSKIFKLIQSVLIAFLFTPIPNKWDESFLQYLPWQVIVSDKRIFKTFKLFFQSFFINEYAL